jgi:protoporphyrin/coproporphyrin ferrochelatase
MSAPNTVRAVRGPMARGIRKLLAIGVSFMADHIETFSDVDIKLAEIARKAGIEQSRRAPALNARPSFIAALADIAASHLTAGTTCSAKYMLSCPECVNPDCRLIGGQPGRLCVPAGNPGPLPFAVS